MALCAEGRRMRCGTCIPPKQALVEICCLLEATSTSRLPCSVHLHFNAFPCPPPQAPGAERHVEQACYGDERKKMRMRMQSRPVVDVTASRQREGAVSGKESAPPHYLEGSVTAENLPRWSHAAGATVSCVVLTAGLCTRRAVLPRPGGYQPDKGVSAL